MECPANVGLNEDSDDYCERLKAPGVIVQQNIGHSNVRICPSGQSFSNPFIRLIIAFFI